ncbi:hypothetical protein QNA08_07530 [Chelatococcus sp. SYSU_G07232]|uniref:Alpha/beta hydrolase n=1 Tax=Chelatococcus albus TaxID=3047466 RepID=A0ABT7AFC5_9HYPH|nr:hypothetical protein [Chelatococcus sp. SYSU_G07232]MDJ1158083.1 hypothetical protein [Chelatococcus sp. SYSU_G07232]
MVRQNLSCYEASGALTEATSFPGRSHFLIAAPGWEDIADAALEWVIAKGEPRAVASS